MPRSGVGSAGWGLESSTLNQGEPVRLSVLGLVAPVLLSAASRPHPAPTPLTTSITTVMYLVDRPDSLASFRAHARQISIIAPQSLHMDAQGFVSGAVPAEVEAVAREAGIGVMPLVTNLGFSQPLMHTVLDAPAARARAIRYLLYLALRDGDIGIQFDYENIHYTYRERFARFFHEAAQAFHRRHLLLSIAVVGKYSDEPGAVSPGGFENWSGVYDYAAIGRDADFVSVMAYPEHAGFSGPGPLAGVPWVTKIVDYAAARMPARRISLGVPLYGEQWTALSAGETAAPAAFAQDNAGPPRQQWKARATSFDRDVAPRLLQTAPVWDGAAQAFVISDQVAGHAVTLWYEDARSLQAKLRLVRTADLAGISGWRLGQEDPAIWELLAHEPIRRLRLPRVVGSFDERSRRAARLLDR